MTSAPDFAALLAATGLKACELRQWVEDVTDQPVARSTIPRWLKGERQADPWAVALLAIVNNPRLLRELRR